MNIIITAGANEGKTTVGILLFKALTDAGFRVFLNDADVKITPGHQVIPETVPLLPDKIKALVERNSIINIVTVQLNKEKANVL